MTVFVQVPEIADAGNVSFVYIGDVEAVAVVAALRFKSTVSFEETAKVVPEAKVKPEVVWNLLLAAVKAPTLHVSTLSTLNVTSIAALFPVFVITMVC
mgnify:CR=1 FL=1